MAISSAGMNLLRLSGLNSGLDTDSIVKNMMALEKAKYNRMYQTKVKNTWKKDAYTDINNTLRKFRDEFASFTSTAGKNLLSKATYNTFKVDMQTNHAVSATATATAKAGTYTVSVEEMARGQYMESSRSASNNQNGFSDADLKAQIGSLRFGDGKAFNDFEDVLDADGNVTARYVKFSINGVDFKFKDSDSLQTMMDKVNSSSAGVTMSYSQLEDKFVIESKTTGDIGQLALGVNGDPVLTKPVLDPDNPQDPDYLADLAAWNQNKEKIVSVDDATGFLAKLGMDGTVEDGNDAVFTINGVETTAKSNNVTIDGVSYNLKASTWNDDENEYETFSFTISRDVSQAVEAVKTFVDEYNKLMESLYNTFNQKTQKDYTPLTEDQRENMTEEEIKNWEAKAKEGILRRDPAIAKLLDDMKSAVSSVVGDMGVLSSVGVSGQGYKPGEASLIELDVDKLTQALMEDPDKVYNLFARNTTDEFGNLNLSQSGMMVRLNEVMDRFAVSTKTGSSNAIKVLDELNTDWDARMKQELTRLSQKEESLYKKFTALETAMSKMQSQTNSLTSYFSSGS